MCARFSDEPEQQSSPTDRIRWRMRGRMLQPGDVRLHTLDALLKTVAAGATLTIRGPSLLPGNHPESKASLESDSGARFVELEGGSDLAPLLDALAAKWVA